MTTRFDEIADGIFRISTFVPEVAPPAGFAFNQFLIRGEDPLLFHTGHRSLWRRARSRLSVPLATTCSSTRTHQLPDVRS